MLAQMLPEQERKVASEARSRRHAFHRVIGFNPYRPIRTVRCLDCQGCGQVEIDTTSRNSFEETSKWVRCLDCNGKGTVAFDPHNEAHVTETAYYVKACVKSEPLLAKMLALQLYYTMRLAHPKLTCWLPLPDLTDAQHALLIERQMRFPQAPLCTVCGLPTSLGACPDCTVWAMGIALERLVA